MIDKESQEFYRKQLHRPIRRFFKAVYPLAMAATIVFTIMLIIFYFISFMINSGGHLMIISHTFLAILLSVGVISLGHFLFLKRQGSFQPIRIRVRRKMPPFDKD